jgi:hypothetical protein
MRADRGACGNGLFERSQRYWRLVNRRRVFGIVIRRVIFDHPHNAEYLRFLGLFGSSRAVRQLCRICAQCGGTVTDRPAAINCVPADRLLDDNG